MEYADDRPGVLGTLDHLAEDRGGGDAIVRDKRLEGIESQGAQLVTAAEHAVGADELLALAGRRERLEVTPDPSAVAPASRHLGDGDACIHGGAAERPAGRREAASRTPSQERR